MRILRVDYDLMIAMCVMGCICRSENLKFKDEDECVGDVNGVSGMGWRREGKKNEVLEKKKYEVLGKEVMGKNERALSL